MIPYLNRDQREQLLILTMLIPLVDELLKHDKFKPAQKYIKTGRTYLHKGWGEIRDRIDQKEFLKLIRLSEQSKLVLQAKTNPAKDEVIVNMEDLYDLGAAAIGNECTGCVKHDWRTCKSRELLSRLSIPGAQELTSDCEYRQ